MRPASRLAATTPTHDQCVEGFDVRLGQRTASRSGSQAQPHPAPQRRGQLGELARIGGRWVEHRISLSSK